MNNMAFKIQAAERMAPTKGTGRFVTEAELRTIAKREEERTGLSSDELMAAHMVWQERRAQGKA